MRHDSLKGMRCIGLTRCSTSGQAGDGLSNDQQADILKKFAADKEMIWVDEERAEGISGAKTHNRTDIENLFERAETQRDFDVILVQSYDRFTRGGAAHGGYLLFKFQELGVDVISATNDIPDDEYGPLIRDVEFIKGRGTSKATGLFSTRGGAASLFDGRMAYSRITPYGLDKLVLSNSGDKLFKIRNLPGGTQQKLDWKTDIVIERYAKNVKNEPFRHFEKHVDQRILLVPGEPQAVEAVKTMYHMYWVEGVGTPGISSYLNGRGIPATRGGAWNQCSVYTIVWNPIYCQRGICNRWATGEFFNRPTKPGEPPIPTKKRSHKDELRPVSDWHTTLYPDIDIVPAEQREMIFQKQYENMVKRFETKGATEHKRVRSNSSWPLTNLIWDKDTGKAMTGFRSGPNSEYRYYYVPSRRANRHPDDKGKKKYFNALAIEKAVIDALAEVLGDAEAYVPMLERYAAERANAAADDVADLQRLKAEREKLRDKKAFTLEEYGDLGPDMLRKKIAPMSAQIRDLDERIAVAEQIAGLVNGDSKEIVRSVIRHMQESMKTLGEPTSATFRTLLSVFTKTIVDSETSEAHVEVRLPQEAMSDPATLKQLCAITNSPRKTNRFTQFDKPLILAEFHCKRKVVKKHPCLNCTRVRAAA